MKQLLLLCASSLIAGSAYAESYQSFTTLSQFKNDRYDRTRHGTNFTSTFYFDEKIALGPLTEFDYINTKSNLGFGYSDSEDYRSLSLSGEAFINNVLVGGNYYKNENRSYDSHYESYSLSLGYLVNPNLLLKIEHDEFENGNQTSLSADYSHSLGGKDYLGVSFKTDTDFDDITVSSKYFKSLGNDRYFTLSAAITTYDDYTSHHIAGNYYFNQSTSLGVKVAKGEYSKDYGLTAQHHLTNNLMVTASYSQQKDDFSYDYYSSDNENKNWNLALQLKF